MNRLLIVFAFVLTACGPDEPRIDPLLRPVLHKYLSWVPNDGKLDELVSMEFGHVDGFGVCNKDWVNGFNGDKHFAERRIVISGPENLGSAWEAAVMHELAHCLHDKAHSNDSFSLMYPHKERGDEYWEKNLETKVKEMF